MKKIAVLFIMLTSIACLTACTNENTSSLSDEDKAIIELKIDRNYDDTDPFVNEKLFCVSEDLDALMAEGTFELDGERVILEVKNNKTDEILWSNTWEGIVKSEAFPMSLKNLKKDDEYVVSLTGTKVDYATVGINFNSNFVQEKERPLR